MQNIEYVLSLTLAMLMVGGMVAWTAITHSDADTAISCQSGRSSAAVILRGTSIYPACKPSKSV